MNNIHHPSNTLPAGEPNAARWQSAPQSLARSAQRFDGFRRWNALSACALALGLLTACGGGQAPEAGATVSPAKASEPTSADSASHLQLAARGGTAPGLASATEQRALAHGAQLNQATLAEAEQQSLAPGAQTPKSAYLSGDVARKAAAVRIPAYRFYNGSTGAHFYTVSETERATVAATLSPPFSFEGPALSVASDHSSGLASVHRFYNTRTGVHFYTISETERANVVATLPQFAYEGVAYYASQVAGAGLAPLYRFYVPSRGFHFYTASASERDNIIATLGATYTFEGIGYYVLDTGWADRARLPHTGITSSQCYQAGSNTLVPCGGSGATALNPQQDGHRAGIAPMSYSAVFWINLPLTGPLYYANTDCVRDDVTGLIWEGKAASGTRSGGNTYTNLGNNASTDASGYVAAVNAAELCGHTDWRLPTRNELLTIVDYGKTTAPALNTTWFPHTANSAYWSANRLSTDTTQAGYVDFALNGGWSGFYSGSGNGLVRLVRGSISSAPRYSYSTVAYDSDGANNVVNDAWTGLQWRRCEQGRVWGGSSCTGVGTTFTQEQALTHAKTQTGWRMPNVKELSSLTDLSVSSAGAPRIDGTAFPSALAATLWTSTPFPGFNGDAWYVEFDTSNVNSYDARNWFAMRLVRASP